MVDACRGGHFLATGKQQKKEAGSKGKERYCDSTEDSEGRLPQPGFVRTRSRFWRTPTSASASGTPRSHVLLLTQTHAKKKKRLKREK